MSKMILNSSSKGDLVLDTFIGSGTTAVACLDLERAFIGFEIDENNFDIAVKRVNNHKTQLDLFNVESE